MIFGLFRKNKGRNKKSRKEASAKIKRPKIKRTEIRRPRLKTTRRVKRQVNPVRNIKGSVLENKISNGVKKQEIIGRVTHYFPKVRAAVIKITKGTIDLGDTLYIKGYTTDFKQKVASIQIDHVPIKRAGRPQEIGLRVRSRVRRGDLVYKILFFRNEDLL